jgi:hypothetical protein
MSKGVRPYTATCTPWKRIGLATRSTEPDRQLEGQERADRISTSIPDGHAEKPKLIPYDFGPIDPTILDAYFGS